MTQAKVKASLFPRYRDFMPVGAGSLFLIQIFSTLGFSVLYSTLILYATEGLHMSDVLATSITGAFIALNYFLHLLGGYIGGRYLSYRSLFSIGMILQVIGCALVSVPTQDYLVWGLSAFLAGTGLNVTCINCMVTQLFEPHDKRRESAFLWNYSGMNIGFFIGFFMSGYFHLYHAYHELFLLSSLGNLIAFVLTIMNWHILRDRDTIFLELSHEQKTKRRIMGCAMIVALFFALHELLHYTTFCTQLIMVVGICMFGVLLTLAFQQKTAEERSKMYAYIILALSSVIFWTLYQLAPMGLILFIERNVDRHFMGLLIAPQWVQNINTIVIIIGGPLLSFIFTHLRERGINFSIPLQFSLALLLIGGALALLPIGISLADAQGLTNFVWIFIAYVMFSIGELFISPIGYAMVGQLAPVRLRGLMMGTWMMISGVAAVLSDYFSKLALGAGDSINPLVTNASYSHIFNLLGFTAIAGGVLLLVFVPAISRMTKEKKIENIDAEADLSEAKA